MRRFLSVLTCALTLSACTYVKVSDEGTEIAQARAPDVVNCQHLGEVESQTRDRVLLKRNTGKVQQELIDLARNQAARMGANAIVPVAEPVNGLQKFNAYRCN